jgi:transposase
MGRRADIKPNKSTYSVQELTELYKKGKNTRMQKKLLAIKMMLEEEKLSSYDVARRLSVSPTSVREWVNKYNRGGYESLKEKGPRGIKSRISDEEFLDILAGTIGGKNPTLERIADLTQGRHEKGLKKSAIWNRLRKLRKRSDKYSK